MKNIHPKYILPLILLPILVFVNHSFLKMRKENKKEELHLEKSSSLNSNIPDANVDDIIGDKLSSLQRSFRLDKGKGFTNVSELEGEEEEELIDLAEQYKGKEGEMTEEERRMVDSITDIVMYQGKIPEIHNPFEEQKKQFENRKIEREKEKQVAVSSTETIEEENIWTNQAEQLKELFKEEENEEEEKDLEDDISTKMIEQMMEGKEEEKRRVEEYQNSLVEVEKVKKPEQGFNTITRTKDNSNLIKAIIDEDVTAEDGSRVRIRILEEIYIEGQLYPKNSTIYAQVSGFQAQRIELMITNVVLEEGIENAEITVYDVDGMKGLFVPKSSFRDFTKDVGAGAAQGSNAPTQNTSGDEESQFMWGVFNNVFNTTTKAVANSARKNRAKIKYGTVIYLKNNKK